MNEELTSPYNAPLSTEVQQVGLQVKRLKKIGLLQSGIVYGVTLAAFALIFLLLYLPFVILGGASLMSSGVENSPIGGGGIIGIYVIVLIAGPLLYGVMGFIGGIISAAIYNLVAKFTGGLEFTLEG